MQRLSECPSNTPHIDKVQIGNICHAVRTWYIFNGKFHTCSFRPGRNEQAKSKQKWPLSIMLSSLLLQNFSSNNKFGTG